MSQFLTTNSKLPSYMVFPRFLLNCDLSETTKILYMILLDRTRLSIKNRGWSNNQGHVYIHFTISELADTLLSVEEIVFCPSDGKLSFCLKNVFLSAEEKTSSGNFT